MSEQMQDSFERLDEVGKKLGYADGLLVEVDHPTQPQIMGEHKLRDARKLLTETTAQLRRDYGQMERARDAAVELLTDLGERLERCYAYPGGYQNDYGGIHDDIIHAIALLQGGGDEANSET